MAKISRRPVGLDLTAEFVRRGFELIDNRDGYVVSRPLNDEVNLLVYVEPYGIQFPSSIQVDITLGLQYPALQNLWYELLERGPTAPAASWSILGAKAEKWCPESERAGWIYPPDGGFAGKSSAVADAVLQYGLPCCESADRIEKLPNICNVDGHRPWSGDESYILPLALWLLGKHDEASRKAHSFLTELENTPRKPNQSYIDNYRLFAMNLAKRALPLS